MVENVIFEEISGRAAWESAAATDPTPPVIDLDDWQLTEDLETAEQLVSTMHMSGPSPAAVQPPPAMTQDTLRQVAQWHAHSRHKIPDPPRDPHRYPLHGRRKRRWFAWTFLSLGLMTFVCGTVLSGLSFATGHETLWNIGLPLVLAGQAGLLLGLIFQLEGLWHTNHDTSETLDALGSQLNDLEHTTKLMSSTHSSAAQSFYVHMAEGASPQLLLADLKGQLDMLAMKMSENQ